MFKINSSFIKDKFKYYILPAALGVILIGVGIFLIFMNTKKQKEFDSSIKATNIEKNCENKTEVTTKKTERYFT